jgi:hypothetical protein
MGSIIAFDNLDDSWLYRRGHFGILLYYAVFRHADRSRLPTLFPDVEREISDYLHDFEPQNYPDPGGSLGYISFTDYPLEERRELFEAMRRGVDEIRNTPPGKEIGFRARAKDQFVELGEELIDMMAKSLAKSDASNGDAQRPDDGQAPGG